MPKGGSMTLTGQTPDGKKRQVDLQWATTQWPTPQAHDIKGAPGKDAQARGGFQSSLSPTVRGKGRLSWRWVCQLMGLPPTFFDIAGLPVRGRFNTRGKNQG